MDEFNEIDHLREKLKDTEASCGRQAGTIFELDAEIRTLKLRMHSLLEENSFLKNKLQYYMDTVVSLPVKGSVG